MTCSTNKIVQDFMLYREEVLGKEVVGGCVT